MSIRSVFLPPLQIEEEPVLPAPPSKQVQIQRSQAKVETGTLYRRAVKEGVAADFSETRPFNCHSVNKEFFPIEPSKPGQTSSRYSQSLSQALFKVREVGQERIFGPAKRQAPAVPPKPKPPQAPAWQFTPSTDDIGGLVGYWEEDDLAASPVAHSSETGRTALVQVRKDPLRVRSDWDVHVLIPEERFDGIGNESMGLVLPNGTVPYRFLNRPRALAFYSNTEEAERLVCGTEDGWIDIWNVTPGTATERIFSQRICEERIVHVALSGPYIIAGTMSGKLIQLNCATGEIDAEETVHEGAVFGLTKSRDGLFLATGGTDGTVWFYQKEEGSDRFARVQRFSGFDADVRALAISDHQVPYLLAGGGAEAPVLTLLKAGSEGSVAQILTNSEITSVQWLSSRLACTTHGNGGVIYYEFDPEKETLKATHRLLCHAGRIAYSIYNGKDLLTTFSPASETISSWPVQTQPPKPPKKVPFASSFTIR